MHAHVDYAPRVACLALTPNARHEFLFDVVADPLERANLKHREPARFAELKAAFDVWNKDMLNDPNAPSYGFTSEQLADHFGMDD